MVSLQVELKKSNNSEKSIDHEHFHYISNINSNRGFLIDRGDHGTKSKRWWNIIILWR